MPTAFKTKQPVTEVRTVPYGGLGGCVEVRGGMATSQHIVAYNPNRAQIRRKPSPIETHKQDGSRNTLSSPKAKVAGTSGNSTTVVGLPASLQAGTITKEPSAYQMWEKCEGNPWFATIPHKALGGLSSMPAELPGSLLLPSQGFPQILRPSPPPRLIRVESDPAINTPVPNLTHSSQSSPDLRSEVKIESNFRFAKEVMESLSISSSSSSLKVLNYDSMNIERLIQVLGDMTVDEILDKWMKAVEKELTKLRSFVTAFDNHDATSLATLRLYYEEIQAACRTANKTCETHNEEFRNAQISNNPDHESDLIKVMRAHYRLSGLASFISLPDAQMITQRVKFEELKEALKLSIKVLSGFIRNQMTFQLHQMCGGISERKIRILQDFDRGSYQKRWQNRSDDTKNTTTGSKSPVRDANLKMLMKDLKGFEYGDQDNCIPILQAEQMNMIKPRPELQYIITKQATPEDIVDSYIYSPSVYSTDEFADSANEDDSDYQERISELNRQVHQILRAPTPPLSPPPSLPLQKADQEPPQPCPNRTPPPPPPELPTRLRPPLSPAELTSTICSLSNSTQISPLTPTQMQTQRSATPPQITPLDTARDTNTEYKNALAARDSTIDSLRRKIESLEAQNGALRQKFDRIHSQQQNVRVVSSPPVLRTGVIAVNSRAGLRTPELISRSRYVAHRRESGDAGGYGYRNGNGMYQPMRMVVKA